MAILEVSNLSKIFGQRHDRVRALNDLSFQVNAGEFVGIMGPSGAGKSTLLNILATIETPSTGKVNIAGNDLEALNERQQAAFRRDHLGFVFQDFNLLDDMTVTQNVLLPLTLQQDLQPDRAERLQTVANHLNLTPILQAFPGELSMGQRQRVAAARAVITQPDLLLADEPTGSLDSLAATDFLNYLRQLNEKEKTTILMVTHDPFTASFASRIIFIKDGAFFAEVTRGKSRQQFFDRIIDMEATVRGGGHTRVASD
ncbi:ABC transporter ATP-binding protein [Lacticaseibacillus paracasei]|uniref:ABC transporter ATP-binding protein n=1 Tax=Lacticaseibacillus paracasei TaxID=1597 RepID=UPI0022E6E76E|nr:ABC transporter ATP-binding protein [Lacticaseibacillus paracasei]